MAHGISDDKSDAAILEGAAAAPVERLYRAALAALCELMRPAGARQWHALFLAALEQWDQTGDAPLFRASARGLADLFIDQRAFPALSAVRAACLDACLDLLVATTQTSLDVVRAPDLSGMSADQMQKVRLSRAQLREQVDRASGEPVADAIWQVIDRHWRVRELRTLTGRLCTVCWRRYVTPAEAARLAADRWLRRTLPVALARGEAGRIVQRAAAGEQDPEYLADQRIVDEAIDQVHPPVLRATGDTSGCPHCGSRHHQVVLKWDLLEDPLRLQERPSRYT